MKKTLLLVTMIFVFFAVSPDFILAQSNISRFDVPKIEKLPDDIKAMMKGAEKRFGFVPNVVSALAYRPEFLRLFMGFNKALDRKGSSLTTIEREMMIIVFSAYKGCDYCVASHGSRLSGLMKNTKLVKQLIKDYTKAEITARQKAVIEFGMKVTKDAHSVDEKDFAILKSHGMNMDDIFDTLGYAAFFNMSNRMMSVMRVKPDDQFELK